MKNAKYLNKFVDDLYFHKDIVLKKLKEYPKYTPHLEEVLSKEYKDESYEIPKDEATCKELTDFIFWYSLGFDVDSTVKKVGEK